MKRGTEAPNSGAVTDEIAGNADGSISAKQYNGEVVSDAGSALLGTGVVEDSMGIREGSEQQQSQQQKLHQGQECVGGERAEQSVDDQEGGTT